MNGQLFTPVLCFVTNPAAPGSGGSVCGASEQRAFARQVDGDGNGSAPCDIGAYEVGAAGGAIVYLYDPLYRLTNATYTTGDVFTYTYDAVGNRLTQTTITNTTDYTYDDANRLINVGGVAYMLDNKGSARCDVGAFEVGGLSSLRSRRLADILGAEIAAVRRACRREMTI